MAIANVTARSDLVLPQYGGIEDLQNVGTGSYWLDFDYLKNITVSFEIQRIRLYCEKTSGPMPRKIVHFMTQRTQQGILCFRLPSGKKFLREDFLATKET